MVGDPKTKVENQGKNQVVDELQTKSDLKQTRKTRQKTIATQTEEDSNRWGTTYKKPNTQNYEMLQE